MNLIIFNEHEGTRFKGSSAERVQEFRQILMKGERAAPHSYDLGGLSDLSLLRTVRAIAQHAAPGRRLNAHAH